MTKSFADEIRDAHEEGNGLSKLMTQKSLGKVAFAWSQREYDFWTKWLDEYE